MNGVTPTRGDAVRILAHFAWKLSSNQEWIATESLTYLFEQNKNAGSALLKELRKHR